MTLFLAGIAFGAGLAIGQAAVRYLLWQYSHRLFALLNDPRG